MRKHLWKIAAVAMMLAMSLALAACGSSGSSSAASASASFAASTTSSATSTASSTASTLTTMPTGTVNGDTYTNSYFDFSYTLPAGYRFKTDAEVEEMNAGKGNLSTDEDILKALESGNTIFDMACIADGGTNLNSTIEYSSDPAAKTITGEDYLQIMESNFDTSLKASGITVLDCKETTWKSPTTGKEYPVLELDLESKGTKFKQRLTAFAKDGCFSCLTATAVDSAELDNIFSGLK